MFSTFHSQSSLNKKKSPLYDTGHTSSRIFCQYNVVSWLQKSDTTPHTWSHWHTYTHFHSPCLFHKAKDRIQHYQTGEEFIFPYDLGSRWLNFKQIFTWSGTPKGDGIEWPVHPKCHQHTLTVGSVLFVGFGNAHTTVFVLSLFSCIQWIVF